MLLPQIYLMRELNINEIVLLAINTTKYQEVKQSPARLHPWDGGGSIRWIVTAGPREDMMHLQMFFVITDSFYESLMHYIAIELQFITFLRVWTVSWQSLKSASCAGSKSDTSVLKASFSSESYERYFLSEALASPQYDRNSSLPYRFIMKVLMKSCI